MACIDETVRRVAEAVKKSIPGARVVLFGSRARGDCLRTSDIDLIVVSEVFREIHFTDRASAVLRALYKSGVRLGPDIDIDILCYTPEELEVKRRELGSVREALEQGIEL